MITLLKKYRVPGFAMLLALVLGFLYIGHKDYHLDEVATILISRDGALLSTKLWNFEGNMWLFYTLLHFWLYLGSGETLVRSFSVLWGVLTIIPFYALTNRLFGKRAASFAVLLLPFQVLFVKNMQFVRGYSLEMLLVVLATYLLVLLLEKRTTVLLILYALVAVLAVYTHIYGGLVVAAHFAYVVLLRNKKHIGWIVVADALIFAGILPLLLSPAIKSSQINWISAPDLYSLAATAVMLTGDFIPLSICVLAVIGWFAWQKKSSFFRDSNTLLLLCWGIFPILVAFVFSLLVKPIYNLQYFTIVLPAAVIMLAAAIAHLKNKAAAWGIIAIIAALCTLRLFFWYTDSTYRYMAVPNVNAPWSQIATYIAANKQPTDGVIIFPTYVHISYDFYATQPSIPLEPLRLATGKPVPFNENLLQAVPGTYSRIWYVYNERAGTATDPHKREIEKVLHDNYTLVSRKAWYEVSLALYNHK